MRILSQNPLSHVILIIGWCFLCVAFKSEQPANKYLYYAVYDAQAATNHIVHIKRHKVLNGVLQAPETWMDVVTKKAGDKVPSIRFDLGPNTIHKNRWLVTHYGNVIDLKEKKVSVDEHDQVLKLGKDSIVFFTNDIFKGKYYSYLNLQDGQYKQITAPGFRPVKNREVEADGSLKYFRIWYFPESAARQELVKDAGYGEDVSLIPNAKPQLPLHWISLDEFIYPYYNAAHTNLSIMKVNVLGGKSERIGGFDNLPENHVVSKFISTVDGRLVYKCAAGLLEIDVAKKVVKPMDKWPAGNDFFIGVTPDPKDGNTIWWKDQKIGAYFCDPFAATTSADGIALPVEMLMGGERFLMGAGVWTTSSGKWKTVGDSDLSAVLGWTQE